MNSKPRRLPASPAGLLLIAGMAALLIAGGFLRSWHLGNASLWIDEGYSITAANAVLAHGYPLLESGKVYDNSLLTSYLIAGSMKLFPFDPFHPWAARVPALLFGTGAIAAMYLLGRQLLGSRYLAFLGSAVVAFSVWEIGWAREARGYAAMQLFLLLLTYGTVAWLQSGRKRELALAIGAGALAYLSHNLALVFFPAIALVVAAYWILHPGRRPSAFGLSIGGAIALVLGTLLVWPRIAGMTIYAFPPIYFRYLFSTLVTVTIGSAIGAALGAFDRRRFFEAMTLVSLVFVPLLLILKFGPVIQIRYLFPVFPFMALLTLYAIDRLAGFVPRLSDQWRKALVGVLALLAFFPLLTLRPAGAYQTEPDSPKPDFDTAYGLVRDARAADDIVISPYAHLSQLYLGDRGYWLPISLTGRQSELEDSIVDGKDLYVAAPVIASPDELLELTETRHGFIVVDEMARRRLTNWDATLEATDVSLLYESGSGLNRLWVYRF